MKGRILQRFLGKLAMVGLHRKRGVQIGKHVWISQLVYLDELHTENIVIKDNVVIGFRCTIFAHFYLGEYRPDEQTGNVVIERDAFIGPNCTILNGSDHRREIGGGRRECGDQKRPGWHAVRAWHLHARLRR